MRRLREPAAKFAGSPGGRVVWGVVKWGLCVAVLYAVWTHAAGTWAQRDPDQPLTIRWGWIAVSAVAYAVSWIPSVWFWGRFMARTDKIPSWPLVARAYYCGHLGKYLPGKALVVIMRGRMMSACGVRTRSAVVGVFYETMMMMGAGLAVSAALVPAWIEAGDLGSIDNPQLAACVDAIVAVVDGLPSHPVWPLLGVVAVCAAVVWPATWAMNVVAAKILPKVADDDTPPAADPPEKFRGVTPALVGGGMAAFFVAWLVQGVSLWASLCAVGVDASLADWATWTAVAAASTSVAFAMIFAPGGIGVREGLLMALMKPLPMVGATPAVAAAVVWRLVGVVVELVVASVLFFALRGGDRSEPAANASAGETPGLTEIDGDATRPVRDSNPIASSVADASGPAVTVDPPGLVAAERRPDA
ncbi:MAG: lysylphosphatidylglycerol synthase domain-containing protein [Planctomycetota bacterium]